MTAASSRVVVPHPVGAEARRRGRRGVRRAELGVRFPRREAVVRREVALVVAHLERRDGKRDERMVAHERDELPRAFRFVFCVFVFVCVLRFSCFVFRSSFFVCVLLVFSSLLFSSLGERARGGARETRSKTARPRPPPPLLQRGARDRAPKRVAYPPGGNSMMRARVARSGPRRSPYLQDTRRPRRSASRRPVCCFVPERGSGSRVVRRARGRDGSADGGDSSWRRYNRQKNVEGTVLSCFRATFFTIVRTAEWSHERNARPLIRVGVACDRLCMDSHVYSRVLHSQFHTLRV